MPKRAASRSWKKKRSFKKKVRVSAGSSSARSQITRVVNPNSFTLLQPVPDRYFTWLVIENSGHYNLGSAADQDIMLGLSQLPQPFSATGGVGTGLLNAKASINSLQYTGMKNLLFNSTTGTGLWSNYRIWTTMTELTVNSTADTFDVGMAPVEGTGSYPTIQQLAQAPQSVRKTSAPGSNQLGNPLKLTVSLPKVLGITKKEYGAYASNTYGVFGTPPAAPIFLQISWSNILNGVTGAATNVVVKQKAFVEFFGRVDTGLLE